MADLHAWLLLAIAAALFLGGVRVWVAVAEYRLRRRVERRGYISRPVIE
ncbi:hypothetical protein [Variovorax sp. OK605]|nr:hypothetical protein [Variovorax sp. OK605]